MLLDAEEREALVPLVAAYDECLGTIGHGSEAWPLLMRSRSAIATIAEVPEAPKLRRIDNVHQLSKGA